MPRVTRPGALLFQNRTTCAGPLTRAAHGDGHALTYTYIGMHHQTVQEMSRVSSISRIQNEKRLPQSGSKLAEQALAGLACGAEEAQEPIDVVSVLVYMLGVAWFAAGPIAYILDRLVL